MWKIKECRQKADLPLCVCVCVCTRVWVVWERSLELLATVNSTLLTSYLFPSDKDGIQKAYQILVRLGLSPLQEDCVATHRICQIVSTRSASLCAATLAAVLWRIKENTGEERLRSTIGVDGSVYKKHPQ